MIYIHRDVYDAIRDALSNHLPECGGVLGAVPGSVISKFYYDEGGRSTPDSYTPDYLKINEVLENFWAPQGIQMVGIVHSHGDTGNFPSCGDLFYCEQIMKSAFLKEFLLPIVTLNPYSFHMYVVRYEYEKLSVQKDQIALV